MNNFFLYTMYLSRRGKFDKACDSIEICAPTGGEFPCPCSVPVVTGQNSPTFHITNRKWLEFT